MVRKTPFDFQQEAAKRKRQLAEYRRRAQNINPETILTTSAGAQLARDPEGTLYIKAEEGQELPTKVYGVDFRGNLFETDLDAKPIPKLHPEFTLGEDGNLTDFSFQEVQPILSEEDFSFEEKLHEHNVSTEEINVAISGLTAKTVQEAVDELAAKLEDKTFNYEEDEDYDESYETSFFDKVRSFLTKKHYVRTWFGFDKPED